jgi:hypothetical protein
MSIVQKNVFGNNITHQIWPDFTRNLNEVLKEEITSILKELEVTSAVIRIEHGSETNQFAQIVAQFLLSIGINVSQIIPVMMSEIQRSEFSIQKHPSYPTFAIVKIGTLI